MGTMSVDFIVMGIHRHRETVVDLAERVLTMCFTPHLACANSDAAVAFCGIQTRTRAHVRARPWNVNRGRQS